MPFGSPFEEIPSDVFRDFKRGLAGGIDVDLGDAGRMLRVDLEIFAAQTDAFEAAAGGAAQRIAADAAGDDAVIAEKAGHVGEVGGAPPSSLPLGRTSQRSSPRPTML